MPKLTTKKLVEQLLDLNHTIKPGLNKLTPDKKKKQNAVYVIPNTKYG